MHRTNKIGKDSGTGTRCSGIGTLKDAAGQSFQGHKFTQMFQSILRCPGTIQIQFDPQIAGAAQRTPLPCCALCYWGIFMRLQQQRSAVGAQCSLYSEARKGFAGRKQDTGWTGAGYRTQRTSRASH